MGYPRTSRISEEIKRIVSQLMMNELKDPRLSPLTSIVGVEVTKDLRYANIYISVYGSQEEKENSLKALQNAAGYIRKEIGRSLKLRYTPELLFKIDQSIEQGMYISDLISKVTKKDAEDGRENDV
ncbi:30S ribosome-binding factor RbfA [Thermotalea metallivorans]|uniref:Ribosome-binding factor A n=1 Tax=Thermotalea metallivorans TaxID=520762 RepID=A0A140L5H1_9FIRM|nr:30S ribosome-binding factor RbfA [Thermotalea metallivorans]KXG75796.1 Ribosome-binding factor A [Thermotalea metallivorans]